MDKHMAKTRDFYAISHMEEVVYFCVQSWLCHLWLWSHLSWSPRPVTILDDLRIGELSDVSSKRFFSKFFDSLDIDILLIGLHSTYQFHSHTHWLMSTAYRTCLAGGRALGDSLFELCAWRRVLFVPFGFSGVFSPQEKERTTFLPDRL